MALEFTPARFTIKGVQFTYTAGTAEVLTINAVGTLPRLQSKTKFGISVRARSALPRLQSKTQFGTSVRARSELPRLQSKGSVQLFEFKPKNFSFVPAEYKISGAAYAFTTPEIVGLVAVSYLPLLESRARLSPPMDINAIATLPLLQSESDIFVPFGLRSISELPRLQSFTRILIPPIIIDGKSELPRLASFADVQVPVIAAAKAKFRLRSSGTMNISVNAISDGYFGALQSEGELAQSAVTGRRRRLSTSVN